MKKRLLALLQQTVCQRRFAVVNMRNDGEIANLLAIFHVESSLSVNCKANKVIPHN